MNEQPTFEAWDSYHRTQRFLL